MPEYALHPGGIMIKFARPEDCAIRVSDKVTDGRTFTLINGKMNCYSIFFRILVIR